VHKNLGRTEKNRKTEKNLEESKREVHKNLGKTEKKTKKTLYSLDGKCTKIWGEPKKTEKPKKS